MKRNVAIFATALFVASIAGADDRWPAGSSGIGSTWLSALNLADQKMSSALSNATYEWHHWSMKDSINPFSSIDLNTWAYTFDPVTGTCPTGLLGSGVEFIWDFAPSQTCATGTGGGTAYGLVCRCASIPPGDRFGPKALADEAQPHYWVTAVTGGATGALPYQTDLDGNAYPKPLLRLDSITADSCVATEEVSRPVTFQLRDRPAFYYEITPWNYDAITPDMVASVADSISFVGWKLDDANSVGNVYINTNPGTTTAALEIAQIVDGFGVMWVGSKWYAVWIKSSVLAQSDVIFDPVAVYGSLSNYLSLHEGGSVAFAIQTDVSNIYSGAKTGAYQVTNFVDSTNWHSQFVPFTMGTGGSPRSGYAVSEGAGGVGISYHRVAASCIKTGSAATHGRLFLSQMDIVK